MYIFMGSGGFGGFGLSSGSEFLGIRLPIGGPFLVYQDGLSLSVFQFGSVFRRCLGAAGYDPLAYSSHYFRIGATTEAARWGLDNSVIKCIRHWDSGLSYTYAPIWFRLF